MKKRRFPLRLLAAAVLAALGVFCIVFRFFGMRFSGFLLIGVAVLLVASALLGVLVKRGRIWRICHGVFYGALVLGLLCFGALEAQVLRAAAGAPEEAEVAIVLGAGVNGTQPSLALKSRLDAALAYAEKYPETVFVLTGGRGYGEEITEAECMRQYLVRHGVDEGRLLLEEQAENTEENFRFSIVLLDTIGYDTEALRVAVVSNDFHLCRAKLMAKQQGLSPVGVGAPIPYAHLEVNYYIREAFALAAFYVL